MSNEIVPAYNSCSTLFSVFSYFPQFLARAATEVHANRHRLNALIDSYCTDSFINETIVKKVKTGYLLRLNALINSYSTDNFINETIVKKLKLDIYSD